MNNRIELNTDASYDGDVGVGVGYSATVNGENITNGKFFDEYVNSTQAEMLSTAWSINNLTQYSDINPTDYVLVVKTDCENTVTKYNGNHTSKYMKFIRHYSRKYADMLMFWIPREDNVTADSIAKSMLRRGIEDD